MIPEDEEKKREDKGDDINRWDAYRDNIYSYHGNFDTSAVSLITLP